MYLFCLVINKGFNHEKKKKAELSYDFRYVLQFDF